MITDFFINIDESRVFRSALQQAYEKLQYAKGWFIFSDYIQQEVAQFFFRFVISNTNVMPESYYALM